MFSSYHSFNVWHEFNRKSLSAGGVSASLGARCLPASGQGVCQLRGKVFASLGERCFPASGNGGFPLRGTVVSRLGERCFPASGNGAFPNCYFPIVSLTFASRLGISRCWGHLGRQAPHPTHEEAGSPRWTGDMATV